MQGDSLTKAELDEFRADISEELSIGMPGSPVYQFNAEDLVTTGAELCYVHQDTNMPCPEVEVHSTMQRMLSLLFRSCSLPIGSIRSFLAALLATPADQG